MGRLPSRVAAVLVAGLIAIGVLGGCGSDDTDTSQQPGAVPESEAPAPAASTDAALTTTAAASASTASDGAAPATASAAAPETRAEILLLEGELLDGQQFDSAVTAGNDVLLWFWAPW